MGEQRVVLGRVSGLFGVKGWVKLHSFTEPPENLLAYRDLELGLAGRWRAVRLEEARPHGRGLIGRFAGIADRDAAAALLDAELAVDRTGLPATAADEYYWADLVGLAVETVDGLALGRVDHLIETGAHDVLVVSGERERLIPWVPGQYVTEVDLAGGRIVVDWDPEF
jgi:16S rRNA processing protein RimM